MNHNSQKSVIEFEKEGILKDSEFVWVSWNKHASTGRGVKVITRRMYEDYINFCKLIGPAGTCEELGDVLFKNPDLKVKVSYELDKQVYVLEVHILETGGRITIKAKTLLDVLEQGIIRYLKENKK